MNILNSIYSSWNEVKKNWFDSFFLFFELIACVGMIEFFEGDLFLIFNLFIVLFVHYYKGIQFSKGLTSILFILVLLFIQSFFSVGANIFSITYFGFILRIVTAFYIISYFRHSFFLIFENIVFLLALFSLPFYIIQVINVQFFNLFTGLSELLLNEERLTLGRDVLAGHRYFVLFGVNTFAEWRNSGFAWEPAGYGAMLLLAIFVNLIQNKFLYNAKLLILLIATVSTFSNGTYIAGFVLFLFALYNSKGSTVIFVIISLFIFSSVLYVIPFFHQRIDFMIDKSMTYNQSIEDNDFKQNVAARKNRVQGTILAFDLLMKKPFGFGLDPHSDLHDIDSASGFAALLFKFGIIGFFILIILLRQVFFSLKLLLNSNVKGWLLFVFFFFLVIIANPFYNQPFFLSIVLYGFIIGKENQALSENNVIVF